MKIKSISFVKSSQSISQCPETPLPEFAFIGRSNVGKSSLINMLSNRRSLAKVSSVPGKTQLINHFLVNDNWHLVDLPGYGWAKVGLKVKEKWEKDINNYLFHRENLFCVFVLVDARHDPQKNDLGFMQWLAENGIPFMVVFTKADKVSNNKIEGALARYRKIMKLHWEVLPRFICTSSESGRGKEEILDTIQDIIAKVK